MSESILPRARDEVGELRPICAASQRAYASDARRLCAGRVCIGTRETAARYRAAWVWAMRTTLKALLDSYSRTDNNQHVEAAIRAAIARHLAALAVADAPAGKLPKGDHSKRRGLRHLPDDWREQLLNAAPHGLFRRALALMVCTGLRPSELALGVEVTVIHDGVTLGVCGTKVTSGNGQPWRRYLIPHTSRWAEEFVQSNRATPYSYRMAIGTASLRNKLARHARRVLPPGMPRVTPYMFRHQLAADLKAGKESPIALAKILGHRSTRTQSAYGTAAQGKQGSAMFAADFEVEVAKPIRDPDHPSPGCRQLVTTHGEMTERMTHQ